MFSGENLVLRRSTLGLWLITLSGVLASLALTYGLDPEVLRLQPQWVNVEIFRIHDGYWLTVCLVLLPLSVALARTQWLTAVGTLFSSAEPKISWALAVAAAVLSYCVIGILSTDIDFPLSLDEFLATFQATAFGAGHVFPVLPSDWVPAAPSLQPLFMRYFPEYQSWGTGYSPIWAVIIALYSSVGLGAFANATFSAMSVFLIALVARRIWPEEPLAPFLAAIFIALSPQTLITGMTSYAMPSNLFFNTLWLLLFLRDDKVGHMGAGIVGFFATGLHQIYVHPLFAVPFCAHLLIRKRYKSAFFYLTVYVAILAFWLFWRDLAAMVVFDTQQVSEIARESQHLSSTAATFLMHSHWSDIPFVLMNIVRFMGWQFLPAALGLVVGFFYWRSAPEIIKTMVIGVYLALLFHLLMMPYQGHGWGYRYLHPMMANCALFSVYAFLELRRSVDRETWQKVRGICIVLAVGAVFVNIPLRTYQAHAFAAPYARADAYIKSLAQDIVVITGIDSWFSFDLVRNDPFLDNRPKVVAAFTLTPETIQTICRAGQVALLDHDQFQKLGLKSIPIDVERLKKLRERVRRTLINGGCELVRPTVPPNFGAAGRWNTTLRLALAPRLCQSKLT